MLQYPNAARRRVPMRGASKGIIAAAGLAAFLSPGAAQADPDELMGCRIAVVKAFPSGPLNLGMTKFVCKGTFALPSVAPSSVAVRAYPDPLPFPCVGNGVDVPCTGLGNPAGSKGYRCKYVDPNVVPVILIKPNVVKGVMKLDLPFTECSVNLPYLSPDLRIILEAAGKRYCALFTAPLKNDATQYKSKVAPPPAACSPSGAFLAEDGGLF